MRDPQPRHVRTSRREEILALLTVTGGFFCRFWLAQATFLNTDEAWHFSVANQASLGAAYRASLTLAHPPLLTFILYFWKHFGMSEVMLRLPGVIAGSIFCWIFYKWLRLLFTPAVAWIGLLLATFLPPMIELSAELRQYSPMLMFAMMAAYFLECALAQDSVTMMAISSLSLYLAMLSHYSAFLFAAALGIYAIARMVVRRPPGPVMAAWIGGQLVGVGLAGFLYETHVAKLGSVYPVAQPLERFGDFYLSDWYFHAGRDRLLPFLVRGTFGVFRFIFGHTGVGQIAAIVFLAGIVLLLSRRKEEEGISPKLAALLLASPFLLNWIAVFAGLYPYGRTRQCMFLSVFALAGVSVALAAFVRDRVVPAIVIAILLAAFCHLFGKLQGRDMLPLAEQRREHMEQAMQFIREKVSTHDEILTDRATSFQLQYYLCHDGPVEIEAEEQGFESFACNGMRIFFTGANAGALTPESVETFSQSPFRDDSRVWVVEGGWATGLGDALKRDPDLSLGEDHSFGRFLEIVGL